MKSTPTEHISATCLDDVTAALADGHTSVLAGGQSLFTDSARGVRRVVDINRVAGFDTLAVTDGRLRIAPLVRHRTFVIGGADGPLGRLLCLILQNMGHPPVRERGTALGSLAYAHPGAEWPVAAVLLDGEFDLVGPDGSRTVGADRFFVEPFTTVRRPEEFLAEVRLPLPPPAAGIGYAEDRPGAGCFVQAATMAAVTVTDDVVSAAAVGLINAGPCPVRARAAGAALIGAAFSDAAINTAAEAAADLDAPLDLVPEAQRNKRRRLIRLLTRRALTQARSRQPQLGDGKAGSACSTRRI
ncbi:FAD binding domain-containing protein [Actinoplanes sp. NPDC049596]|uniref:FAD binding domain-containing protein n=1 Tax=unclassified Actinoplanes TaxID=2626549 RepID=UPI0034328839